MRYQRPGTGDELVGVEWFRPFSDQHCGGDGDLVQLLVFERKELRDPRRVVELAAQHEPRRALVVEERHSESTCDPLPYRCRRGCAEQDGQAPEHEAEQVQWTDPDGIEEDR